MTLDQWKNSTLKNYCAKHSVPTAEVEHILEYLSAHPSLRITRLSYPQAKLKAEQWISSLNKKHKGLKNSGQVSTFLSFPNGLKFVRLEDQTAKNWEGLHMGHCVASYTRHDGLFSLRDHHEIPHCTIEVVEGRIRQIKGRGNGKIVPKYQPYLIDFLRESNYEITGDTAVLRSLNYYLVSKAAQKIIKDSVAEVHLITLGKNIFLDGNKSLILNPDGVLTGSSIKRALHKLIHRWDDVDLEAVLNFILETQNEETYSQINFERLGNQSVLRDSINTLCTKSGVKFLAKLLAESKYYRSHYLSGFFNAAMRLNRLDILTWLLKDYPEEVFRMERYRIPQTSKAVLELFLQYHVQPRELLRTLASHHSFNDMALRDHYFRVLAWFPDCWKFLTHSDLIFILKYGECEFVRQICQARPELLKTCDYRQIDSQRVEIIKILLDLQVGLDSFYDTFLQQSCLKANHELIDYYCALGAEFSFSLSEPMAWAIKNNDIKMVQLLLKQGYNPHGENYSALSLASNLKHLAIRDLLLNGLEKTTPSDAQPLNLE